MENYVAAILEYSRNDMNGETTGLTAENLFVANENTELLSEG